MPPQATGAYNQVKQALSIFSPFNKVGGDPGIGQGTPDLADEYKSSMSNEDIIQLTSQWTRDYATYYGGDIEGVQKTSYEYWLGKQTKQTVEDMMDANRNIVDNRIFNALETFIPIATRANPDPLVTIDPSAASQQLGELVQNFLSYQADKQKLRMLNKAIIRDWALFKIGVMKLSWDTMESDIKTEIINPKRILLDPQGYVREGGIFTGEWIGERKKLSASKLVELFPSSKEFIIGRAGGKKGTKLEICEWWYKGKDYFFTLDDHVLGKFKNYLWNYDGTDPLTGEEIQGSNHLPQPMSPYLFLSVYSTRTQPHDETSLIQQNLPIQDMVNRRFRQIDKNVDSINNGIVVSGVFNSEQASLAAEAIRKGGAIRVPNAETDVRTAVMRLPAPNLADSVFANLQDARNELDNIFGTKGSTAEGVDKEDTVRGKILSNQMDASRIGGGVTEFLEQVDDSWYNWCLQIAYVYYDMPHYASALGQQGAQELTTIKSTDLVGKILVTVKEGSMIPKDPLTKRNEAIDLWSAEAIDPVTLYQKLDYPDPFSAAENLLKWRMIAAGTLPPQYMFPDFPQAPLPVQPQQPGGQPQGIPPTQPGIGGPAVSPPPAGGEMNQPPPAATQGAVGQQSQQLIQSAPIGKV